MTNDERLEALRLSAKGCGYYIDYDDGELPYVVKTERRKSFDQAVRWNPLENPAQLVECLEALIKHCYSANAAFYSLAIRMLTNQSEDWKLSVVLAVAETARREK